MKTKTTKLFYCVLIFVSFTVGKADAQMVYMPDTNFRNALISGGCGGAIYGDSLDAGSSIVTTKTYLQLGSQNIYDITGIAAFVNLISLNCLDNYISFLPPLPPLLQGLDVGYNNLSSIPSLPVGLTGLLCDGNNLTSLPTLPASLIGLNCRGNAITSLPVLPPSVTNLDCGNNMIAVLPSLPAGLNYFVCRGNLLSTIPPLPNNYYEFFDCSYNQLISLPILPDSIKIFYCPNNQLTVFPNLPTYMEEFDCTNNLITSLPSLSQNLQSFWCPNNQLTSLPELPDAIKLLFCSSNPNLTCLPKLNDMEDLYFNGTAITCIPNYVHISDISYPLIDTMPICGMFNGNGCNFYWNISGTTYLDNNAGCVMNSTDTLVKNIPIELYKNGVLVQKTSTMGYGKYDFDTDTNGIYEIRVDTTDLPLNVICPTSNLQTDTITALDSLKTGNDFSFSCKGSLQVGIKNVHVGFVPGAYRPEVIYIEDLTNFYGLNCSSGENGIVTILFDGPVTYIGPSPGALTPNTVSGNLLTYIIPDFGTITPASFSIIVLTDTTAVLGSQVCVTVTTITTNFTTNIKKDSLHECFEVVSSWDPNNKQVSPVSDVDINGDGWLIYTINFQNTGTAEANNIYILDTLDNNLDWSTFKLTAYSHQPQIQLFNTGLLRFNFPNINLPDSNTNEPLSHGYVQYKVKLKPGLSLGTQIYNTAYIYFDFNQPVVTNTTQNILVPPAAIAEIKNETAFNIFPNPVHDMLNVSLNNHSPANTIITITDMQGRVVKEEKISQNNSSVIPINVSALSQGVYLLRMDGVVQRFVKL